MGEIRDSVLQRIRWSKEYLVNQDDGTWTIRAEYLPDQYDMSYEYRFTTYSNAIQFIVHLYVGLSNEGRI